MIHGNSVGSRSAESEIIKVHLVSFHGYVGISVTYAHVLDVSLDELLIGSISKNKHIHIKDIREALEEKFSA